MLAAEKNCGDFIIADISGVDCLATGGVFSCTGKILGMSKSQFARLNSLMTLRGWHYDGGNDQFFVGKRVLKLEELLTLGRPGGRNDRTLATTAARPGATWGW
jgi:hypothetical protein